VADSFAIEGQKVMDVIQAVSRVTDPALRRTRSQAENEDLKLHQLVALRLMTERALSKMPPGQRAEVEACVLRLHEKIFGQKLEPRIIVPKNPVTGGPG
jgi:hypothetical protein